MASSKGMWIEPCWFHDYESARVKVLGALRVQADGRDIVPAGACKPRPSSTSWLSADYWESLDEQIAQHFSIVFFNEGKGSENQELAATLKDAVALSLAALRAQYFLLRKMRQ